MAQGKLRVLRLWDGARVLSSPGAAGLRLVAPGPKGRIARMPARATLRSLAEVEQDIASALAPPLRGAGSRVQP